MRVFGCIAALIAAFAIEATAETPLVERFKVTQEDGRAELRGFGSGLTFLEKRGDSLVFLMNTDRGPNVPGPGVFRDGIEQEGVVFSNPHFSPLLAEVVIGEGRARIVRTTPIYRKEGEAFSGLPPFDFHSQLALSSELEELRDYQPGVDPEGVTISADGVWLCEEYGPSLLKIDPKTGALIARYSPENKLPLVLKYRQPNRGFEAIASRSDGSIIAPLQSTLDFGDDSKKRSPVIPVLLFNSSSETSSLLGYPLTEGDGPKHKVKLGDITRIDDSTFIVIQSGELEERDYARLYRIDVSDAENIEGFLNNGSEEVESKRLIKKTLMLDLADVGWSYEKTEGIALLPDRKTVAISNDNDFGVTSYFRIDPKKISFTEKGKLGAVKPKRGDFVVETQDEMGTEIWLLKFSEPLG